MISTLVIVGLCAVLAVVGYLLLQSTQQVRAFRVKYSGIIDTRAELATAKSQLNETEKARRQLESEAQQQKVRLDEDYQKSLSKREEIQQQLALLEENLEDISFGLYKPHFKFDSSEKYKQELESIRDLERSMIRDDKAVVCHVQWTVQNSQTEGKRMMRQYSKLMLRAFNGECDAAVANVTWNNIGKMEERVGKTCEAVNQLGSVMQISIAPQYLALKLKERRLTHEYEDKRYEEKQEERRIREQIREEEKAQREIEKAREQAEKEEADYEKALSRAREESLKATGAQLQKLTDQINTFEKKLDEARQNKQRAIARAQLTKSGFVYVISNIGSFGENVFKIGMTRRLEPMDRIDELGDASVPFPLDLHAMLYSDNAPELEAAIHVLFEQRRVNMVNSRREFYHSVQLEEVEAFVKNRGLSAQFIKMPEAKEYRESLAKRSPNRSAQAASSMQ